MSIEREIEEAFHKLVARDVPTFPVTVLEVDKTKGVCRVTDDDIEYINVRLTSIISDSKQKIYLFPKVGSSVLVSPINEDLNKLYVDKYSEIESVAGIIGNSIFDIDTTGFHIERNGISVKEVLKSGFENQNRLNVELQKVIVSIGVTPDVVKLNQIKTDNNQVITDIQTVFK